MRTSLPRARGLVILLASSALAACSASGSGGAAPATTETAPASPAPSMDAGRTADTGADASDAATKPKNDCKLMDLTGIADVTPTFAIGQPPPMFGGTLSGNYVVDHATIFLPSAAASLVDLKKSTGTVNAWATFSGPNYRLHLASHFDISTVAGPQSQGVDTASQGAFTASGAALTLDHACDTAIAQEADYTFTDTGGARATILIKTPSPYGDIYLELDAAKN